MKSIEDTLKTIRTIIGSLPIRVEHALAGGFAVIHLLSKPYLAAMKLRASGFKDANDVVDLFSLMTEEEKKKTQELAKRIGRYKKLAWILEPPESIRETEAAIDERNELL